MGGNFLETENEDRERTRCSQLEKATEIIMIAHFGNYCTQQVSLVETKQILLSFSICSLLISKFVQITTVILLLSENRHLQRASKFSFKFPSSYRLLPIQKTKILNILSNTYAQYILNVDVRMLEYFTKL